MNSRMDLYNIDLHIIDSNFLTSDDEMRARIQSITTYQKQLQVLMNLPKIQQKTDAWYKAREGMISASDFAQALGKGKFGTQNQLIQKKCTPVDESAFSLTNPFFKWGNMFESVAIEIYSRINKVNVHEFGLLKHPVHDFFGASPDGISNLGIMVEIKCPMKRKIDGDIPTQYYYQIQGQLDVCGLEECDYFECEFIKVRDIHEYKKNFDDYEFKGVIAEQADCHFIYGPMNTTYERIEEFVNSNRTNNNKIILWALKKYNMKRVFRDGVFLNEKLREVGRIWNKILFYRKEENKERYVIEVLNKIDIMDTESFCPRKEKKILRGYALQDLD